MRPRVSIIIPAHNEAGRIKKTLRRLKEYLSGQTYIHEIIVVDDGSSDGTGAIVREMNVPSVTVLTLAKNEGKGAAVRAGMLAAHGTYRLFMDADGSTDIGEIEKLLPWTIKGYDVVIGSRRITGAKIQVKQNPLRELLGHTFRTMTRLLVPLEFEDTQNGFKLFSENAALQVFKRLRTEGWSFDVEVLLAAQALGFKIKEVPITWVNDGRSRLTLVHMLRMLIDLLKIRGHSLRLKREVVRGGPSPAAQDR